MINDNTNAKDGDELQTKFTDWSIILFIFFSHGIGLFGTLYLVIFSYVPWQTWLLAGIMFLLGGLVNSIGYHRLFAHRSFKTGWLIKLLILIISPINCQNSVLKWCSDHRLHHAQTDTDNDPHNAKKGFYYSHIGWMFVKNISDSTVFADRSKEWKDLKNISDLKKDPLINWQHRKFLPLTIITCFVAPTCIAALWHDAIGGLIIAGFARMSLYFQFTCLVNSACHIWGSQPYTKDSSARNNMFVALLTFGEGYHNYHHAFPSDYRNGVIWYQWDPSKWVIKLLFWMKLATDLYSVPADQIREAVKTTKVAELSRSRSEP